MGLLKKNPRKWTRVSTLDVNLGKHTLLGQKYSIEVVCQARSVFKLKAYEQGDPLRKLDSVENII